MTTDRPAASTRSTALATPPAAGRTPAPPTDMFSALLGAATPKSDAPARRDDSSNRRDDRPRADKPPRADNAHRADNADRADNARRADESRRPDVRDDASRPAAPN